jgi:hypothetical protein
LSILIPEFRVKKFLLSSFLVFSFLTNITFAQSPRGNQAVPKNSAAAVVPAKTQPGIEVPFVSKTLPNGLEVIVLPDSSIPLVTVELDVRNGSFTEPPEYHGLSHLFEHMFFKPNQAVMLGTFEIKAADRGRLLSQGRQPAQLL